LSGTSEDASREKSNKIRRNETMRDGDCCALQQRPPI
jgi:hypothetical protein